jgi:signal-transduction protein with cAMP-binding, CBS, and nucleotidyltransferase domain
VNVPSIRHDKTGSLVEGMLTNTRTKVGIETSNDVLAAKDIAQRDFLTLPSETSAIDAAKLMKSKGTQFVVVAARGSLEGIVTEWDFVSKIIAEGKKSDKVKLADIMSSPLVVVDANDGLDKVAQLMTRRKIRRVLVLRDRELYGVITSSIMMAHFKEYIDSIVFQSKKQ